MAGLIDYIKDQYKSAKADYGQLGEAYPNAGNFFKALLSNISQNVPSNQDLVNPQAMAQWSLAAALNAPMMGIVKSVNLPETEFSKAHKLAQKHAALPVEKGGLGLPPNNTAMDRAKAMGFDVNNPVYHGTNADIHEFDLGLSGTASGVEQYGSGIYTTTSPSLASGYAKPNKGGDNVMPLLVKLQNPINASDKGKLTRTQIKNIIKKSPNLEDSLNNYDDVSYYGKNRVLNGAVNSISQYQDDNLLNNLHPIANDFFSGENKSFADAILKVLKKDGVKVDFSDKEKFYVPFQEKNVRSKFAAFDPFKKDSANLLASGLIGALLLKHQMENEQRNH